MILFEETRDGFVEVSSIIDAPSRKGGGFCVVENLAGRVLAYLGSQEQETNQVLPEGETNQVLQEPGKRFVACFGIVAERQDTVPLVLGDSEDEAWIRFRNLVGAGRGKEPVRGYECREVCIRLS
jgi:hypothetical protein